MASVAMVLSFAFFISGAWLLIIGVFENQNKKQQKGAFWNAKAKKESNSADDTPVATDFSHES